MNMVFRRGIDIFDIVEDWRFHHKLIWEIPSVTFAILGGLLTISYSFLGLLPRLIFLILGATVKREKGEGKN